MQHTNDPLESSPSKIAIYMAPLEVLLATYLEFWKKIGDLQIQNFVAVDLGYSNCKLSENWRSYRAKCEKWRLSELLPHYTDSTPLCKMAPYGASEGTTDHIVGILKKNWWSPDSAFRRRRFEIQ